MNVSECALGNGSKCTTRCPIWESCHYRQHASNESLEVLKNRIHKKFGAAQEYFKNRLPRRQNNHPQGGSKIF